VESKRLIFKKPEERRATWVISANQDLYEVKPTRKRLRWANVTAYPKKLLKLKARVVPVNDLNSNLKP
jgi:hypothetical protein